LFFKGIEMKLKIFLDEAKNMDNTMIGFGIDKSSVKKIQDYIKSWLIKNKIKYKNIDSPHISIAQIPEKYPKDDLVRTINTIKKGIVFEPKDIILLKGKNGKDDYVVIEYKVNMDFINAFRKVEDDYVIRHFSSIKPHISLFIIPTDSISSKTWEDIKYSMPELQKIKAKEVELWNKNQEIEFKK